MKVRFYKRDEELRDILPGMEIIRIEHPGNASNIGTRVDRFLNGGNPVAFVIDVDFTKIDESILYSTLGELFQFMEEYANENVLFVVKSRCTLITVSSVEMIDMYDKLVLEPSKTSIIEIGTRKSSTYSNYLRPISSYIDYSNVFRSVDSTLSRIKADLKDRFTERNLVYVILSTNEINFNSSYITSNLTPLHQAMMVLGIQMFSVMHPEYKCTAIFVSGMVSIDEQAMIDKIVKVHGDHVASVYATSILNRDLSRTMLVEMNNCWKFIENAYKGSVVINREMYTFKDVIAEQATGKKHQWKPINAIAKKSILRRVPESNRVEVERCVSFLLSKRRDVEEKSTIRQEATIKRIAGSLSIRKQLLLDFEEYERAATVVESLVGAYPVSNELVLVISNDPVDILRKSTGQDWEEESCEKDGGTHFDGVFSDIVFGNLVAFMRDASTGHDLARIMLRWCIDDDGKIGIGIEARWYYSTGIGTGAKCEYDDPEQQIAYSMRAEQATRIVINILKDLGVYNYTTCTTPYVYGGYSDYIRRSKKEIPYRNIDDYIPKFNARR